MGEEDRENVIILTSSAQALAARNNGNKDECRVSVPQWMWDQELKEWEREDGIIDSWFVIELDDELDPDNAIVSYHLEGKLKDSVAVELKVPAIEAMGHAVRDGNIQ
jgi:hypothetical protein